MKFDYESVGKLYQVMHINYRIGFALLVTGLALHTTSGCALLQSIIAGASKPSAKVTSVRVTNLSLKDVTLVFDLDVTNPYAVPLPLVNVDYTLATQTTTFLQGQAPIQGNVPANGRKTLSLPATISFAGLIALLQDVRPGAIVPFKATLGLSVDVPSLGPMRIPLEKSGEVPIPAVPDVSLTRVTWQNISLAGATALVQIKIGNSNAFPVDLSNFNYTLNLAGLDLANGMLTNSTHFSSGETQEIGITFSVSTIQTGMAFARLSRASAGQYRLGGAFVLGTPFGPLTIPLNVSGQVPFLR